MYFEIFEIFEKVFQFAFIFIFKGLKKPVFVRSLHKSLYQIVK